MSSQSALWRKKLKENNPEAFAEYLQKQKDRSKKRRDEKKRKWLEEPHTRLVMEEKEKELQRSRERNRKYYAEKKSKGMRRRSTDCATPASKRPKDMTEKELRQHKSELRKNRIARMSHQKKLALKKKNALRMRLARETEKAEKEKKSGLKLKQQLKKKTGSDPDTYGRVVKNLANPRTPEKRAAVKTALNGNRTTKTSHKKLFTRPKRTLSGNWGKKK